MRPQTIARSVSFSVIIPTLDRPDDLGECLQAVVKAARGHAIEIIVVADGPSLVPRIPYAVSAALPTRVLHTPPHSGPDASRNAGAEVATGDVLAFLDDDARPRADWFDIAAAHLAGEWHAITGRVLPFDHGVVSRARQWRYDERYRRLIPGQSVAFLAGGNSAVRRSFFLAAGGFPVRSAGGDNGLVPRLRAVGAECIFVPTLCILHRNGKGLFTAIKQAWNAGRGNPTTARIDTLRTLGTAFYGFGRAAPDVAAVNAMLQLVNTASRLSARADRRTGP